MSAPTWREAAASHPGPFDLGPAVVAYDLVTVRRVALARFAGAVTRRHLQLGRCRGHLYRRGKEVVHELELLLLRVRAIEEAEGVALLEVLAAQGVDAEVRVPVDPLDETAAVTNIVEEGLPLFLRVRLGRAVVDLHRRALLRRRRVVDG